MNRRKFIGAASALVAGPALGMGGSVAQEPKAMEGVTIAFDSCRAGLVLNQPIWDTTLTIEILNKSMTIEQAVVDNTPGQVLLNGLNGNRLRVLGASNGDLVVGDWQKSTTEFRHYPWVC